MGNIQCIHFKESLLLWCEECRVILYQQNENIALKSEEKSRCERFVSKLVILKMKPISNESPARIHRATSCPTWKMTVVEETWTTPLVVAPKWWSNIAQTGSRIGIFNVLQVTTKDNLRLKSEIYKFTVS